MRLLLYSPDSYGLGHVRRSLKIAGRLLDTLPGSTARLLTGSARAHYFAYPAHCDYVRVPRVTKDGAGNYVPANDESTLEEVIQLRARVISAVVVSYRPDLFLIDHSPLGLCGEVLPALRDMSRHRPSAVRVLGLRDVVDEPARVRRAWGQAGVIDTLRRDYDRILVYGQRELFDPIRAYGLPDDVAAKVRFVGYIPSVTSGGSAKELHAQYAPSTGKLVVLTVGGGGDGNLLLRKFIDGFAMLGPTPPFEAVAVTGPLMSASKRQRYHERAAALSGLTMTEYVPDLPVLLEAADFVVCMGGYNTVCEAACAGARTLIVPRVHPRREQLLRAQILAASGAVRFLVNGHATPRGLMDEVLAGLERPGPIAGWGMDFGGLDATARELGQLLVPPAAAAEA